MDESGHGKRVAEEPAPAPAGAGAGARARPLLETVLRNASASMFLMDERQHCIYMNPAAERLTGFTLAEVRGRPLHDVVHHTRPDGSPYPLEECPIDRAFPENHREQGEEVFVHRDGRFYPVAYTASPLRDGDDVIGTILEVRDLTSEKQAREARFRLAAIVESSDDAIVSKNLDGVITSWNRAAERLFGYTAPEAVGQPVTLIIPSDRQEEETGILARLRRGERIDHFETVRQRKDGALLDISLTISPIIDAQGRIIGASKIARDITERKRTEALLQEQTRTLETLNRVAASLSAELDLQKLVQTVTDAGVEMSGARFGAFFYNLLDERGESYTLYTLSGAPREAFQRYPMPRNTHVFGPTFRGEGVVRSDDITRDPRYGRNPPYHGMPEGHLPVRSYLAVPVASRSGEVLGGLFFGHPETGVFSERIEGAIVALASHAAVAMDNAHLYEQARRANETLEDKVRQRTGELEHLNRELESFNYSVSHDLRAPLRSIDGFSQVLLEDYEEVLDDTARHYLQRVRAGAARMGALTDSLLELSRLTRVRVRPDEVDLGELARVVVEDLLEGDAERDVRVEIADGMRAVGDPALLRIVLENLLGNALKFTRNQERALVEVGVTRHEGRRAYFVRDDGAGFDPLYAEKLFVPFGRLHRMDEFEGSGIGLATVQRIIHKHGGRIWAEGEPGVGAAFYFTLGPE